MKIAWITRSFLDYRIPVFEEISKLAAVEFNLFYCKEAVPSRVNDKIARQLGNNANQMVGELRFPNPKTIDKKVDYGKSVTRVFYQPGLIKKVLAFNPDIIITDGFLKWTYAALWLRAFKHIPHVMCYERTVYTERNAKWYRKVYRKFVMRWIDAICCNGSLSSEYIQRLGFPAEKITYGHMVADTIGLQNSIKKVTDSQVSDLKNKYDLKGTVYLYIGQLISRKGLLELLKSWKKCNNTISCSKATLALVGDGRQRQKMEIFIKDNNLNNVRIIGFVDYDHLAQYYKAADVFIIPTLEDNWSLVVPEAMACGLPILCSKYNGCWPELVKPDINGWIFDPLNIDDTTNKLKICFAAKNKLHDMGKRSLDIINNHTASHAAQEILKACKIALCKS